MTGIVVLDRSSSEEEVHSVLSVSNEIFEIDTSVLPKDPPTDVAQWLHHLRNHNGEVVCAVDDSGHTVAFAFVYQRNETDQSQRHIWIAGCQAQHRRKRAMYNIFEFLEKHYHGQGVASLTVNTYPAKFVNMPQLLASRCFECYDKTPPSAAHPELGEKWCYRKTISSYD
jgi:hypothetical protein